MRALSFALVAALGVAGVEPVAAEVTASGESGFVSHNEATVAAAPAAVWQTMLRPAGWWNGEHTYSGDAGNLTIEAAAGGCFCEKVSDSRGGLGMQVEHMRVIHVAPGATLRLSGGLGPLQSEAVTVVLTMTLEPSGQGTKISWDMVVGGFMRLPMTEMAPLVDRVVGEQLGRLAAKLSQG